MSVLAHGIGNRQDLPLPFTLVVTGAAVALLVSFVAMGLLWPSGRLGRGSAGRPLPSGLQRLLDSAGLRWAIRMLGLAATGYVVLAAVAGPDRAANPTAGVVYVLFWVGLVPLSLVFGPVWRLLNPLRTLHLLLAVALRTDPREGAFALPRWLGYWPAAAGLFAFAWLELIAPSRVTLPVLRTWFAVYAGVHLLAAALYGSRWFDKGDAFEVWSGVIGRLSPFGRRADGQAVVRNPLDGMARLPIAPGVVAVVAVMLGTTAYDSLTGVPWWFRWIQRSGLAPTVSGTLGLVGMTALVAIAYVVATSLAGRLGSRDQRGVPRQFAHSVVPIAVGYVIAHYYSLLALEGQRTLIRLSDPLVTGADWLGTGHRAPDPSFIRPGFVAGLQAVAVVTGHVLGVVLAHDRAVRLFPRARAVAGQVPLLVLMVGYTVGGLALLFRG